MIDYHFEYLHVGLDNIPRKEMIAAVTMNGKGGLQIVGLMSRELVQFLLPLLPVKTLEQMAEQNRPVSAAPVGAGRPPKSAR